MGSLIQGQVPSRLTAPSGRRACWNACVDVLDRAAAGR
jgi:hypothetical protein